MLWEIDMRWQEFDLSAASKKWSVSLPERIWQAGRERENNLFSSSSLAALGWAAGMRNKCLRCGSGGGGGGGEDG